MFFALCNSLMPSACLSNGINLCVCVEVGRGGGGGEREREKERERERKRVVREGIKHERGWERKIVKQRTPDILSMIVRCV